METKENNLKNSERRRQTVEANKIIEKQSEAEKLKKQPRKNAFPPTDMMMDMQLDKIKVESEEPSELADRALQKQAVSSLMFSRPHEKTFQFPPVAVQASLNIFPLPTTPPEEQSDRIFSQETAYTTGVVSAINTPAVTRDESLRIARLESLLLPQTINDFKTENEKLKLLLKQKEQDNVSLVDENKRLKTKLANELAGLSVANDDLRADDHRLWGKIEKLTEENIELKKKNLEQQTEIQTLEKSVSLSSERDNHLTSLNSNITSELKKNVEETQKSLKERDEKIASLQLQLQVAKDERLNLNTQLETYQEEMKGLQAKVISLAKEKCHVSSQLEIKNARVLALEKRISCRKEQLDQLKKFFIEEELHDDMSKGNYCEEKNKKLGDFSSVQESECDQRDSINENGFTTAVPIEHDEAGCAVRHDENLVSQPTVVPIDHHSSPTLQTQLIEPTPSSSHPAPSPTSGVQIAFKSMSTFHTPSTPSKNGRRDASSASSSPVSTSTFTGTSKNPSPSATAASPGNKRSALDSETVQKRKKQKLHLDFTSVRENILEVSHDVEGEDTTVERGFDKGSSIATMRTDEAEPKRKWENSQDVSPSLVCNQIELKMAAVSSETKFHSATFMCRSIRVGSYRVTNTDVGWDLAVQLTELGLKFKLPPANFKRKLVTMCIPRESILNMKIHFTKRLQVIFIRAEPKYASWARQTLGLDGSPVHETSRYYCPLEGKPCQQTITFLGDDLEDSDVCLIKKLYQDALQEIDYETANEILMETTQLSHQTSIDPNSNSSDHGMEIEAAMPFTESNASQLSPDTSFASGEISRAVTSEAASSLPSEPNAPFRCRRSTRNSTRQKASLQIQGVESQNDPAIAVQSNHTDEMGNNNIFRTVLKDLCKEQNFEEKSMAWCEKGVDINAEDASGNTILHLAASAGRSKQDIELIIRESGDWRRKNKDGETVLHKAILGGNTEVIKHLIELGMKINAKDNFGQMPVHKICSAKQNFKESLDLLLAHGAAVNSTDKDGNTVLGLAAWNGRSKEDLEYIISKGGDWKMKTLEGLSILYCAAGGGNPEAIKFIIDLGADVSLKDSSGALPWHGNAFTKLDFKGSLNVFLNCKVDINKQDEYGYTILSSSALNGRPKADLEYIVAKGGDCNLKTKDSKTVLHLAAQGGNVEAIKYFVSLEVSISSKDSKGHLPLHDLVENQKNFNETLDVLLEFGATINSVDKNGDTLLGLAAYFGREKEILEYIVSKGGNPKKKNQDNQSILHLAALGGNPEAIKYIISLGGKIHGRDGEGNTPMHLLANVKRNFRECLDTFLERGAKINAKNKVGHTLLDIAVMESQYTDSPLEDDDLEYIISKGGAGKEYEKEFGK